MEDNSTKIRKLKQKDDLAIIINSSQNSKLVLEIPEQQLKALAVLDAKYAELVDILQRKLKHLFVLINPNDLSPRFNMDKTLLENSYKFTKEFERKVGPSKPQNYETQNCKTFNQQFDAMEKIIVQTNSENANRLENNFIFDINRVS